MIWRAPVDANNGHPISCGDHEGVLNINDIAFFKLADPEEPYSDCGIEFGAKRENMQNCMFFDRWMMKVTGCLDVD